MQALRRRSFGSAVPAPSRRSCLPSRRSEDCCKVELKPRCADAPFRSLLGAPPQRCCALLMASMNFIDGLTSLAPLSASLAHRRISSSAVENATLVPQVKRHEQQLVHRFRPPCLCTRSVQSGCREKTPHPDLRFRENWAKHALGLQH